jgi:hypothetical protein
LDVKVELLLPQLLQPLLQKQPNLLKVLAKLQLLLQLPQPKNLLKLLHQLVQVVQQQAAEQLSQGTSLAYAQVEPVITEFGSKAHQCLSGGLFCIPKVTCCMLDLSFKKIIPSCKFS